MATNEKYGNLPSDTATRDEVAALLRAEGGIAGFETSVKLADSVLALIAGRPASAALPPVAPSVQGDVATAPAEPVLERPLPVARQPR